MRQEQKAAYDPFENVRGFKYSGDLRAVYPLSPKSVLPQHIRRPNYGREAVRVISAYFKLFPSHKIRVNPEKDQEGVRLAAKVRIMRKTRALTDAQYARESLDHVAQLIQPGITTDQLDKALVQAAIERNCYPSPLGYHGYPKSVCTSVNEVICHGIPDQRPLQDGDVLNIGYHGDLCVTAHATNSRNATYPVGEKARKSEPLMRLIRTARECLDAAIAICGPGMPYGEIGRVIEPIAQANGCSVVREYTGHGIGRVFHGPPPIYHFPTSKSYGIMKPGHVRTRDSADAYADFYVRSNALGNSTTYTCGRIEPMVNLGNEWRDIEWPDHWTVATKDGSPSAAAEETLLITETGVEILTAQGGARAIDTRDARARHMEENNLH